MTDVDATVIKVHYRRQIQPKQYETAEFAMDVEHVFPAGLSPEEIEKAAARMAQEVKVGVLTQLGMPFEQDEETRVIMEVFKGSEVVAKAAPAAVVAPTTGAVVATPAQEAPTPAPATPKPAAKRAGPNAAPLRSVPTGTDTDAAWED